MGHLLELGGIRSKKNARHLRVAEGPIRKLPEIKFYWIS